MEGWQDGGQGEGDRYEWQMRHDFVVDHSAVQTLVKP